MPSSLRAIALNPNRKQPASVKLKRPDVRTFGGLKMKIPLAEDHFDVWTRVQDALQDELLLGALMLGLPNEPDQHGCGVGDPHITDVWVLLRNPHDDQTALLELSLDFFF